MLQSTSDLNGLFEINHAWRNGHDIWYPEYQGFSLRAIGDLLRTRL